jgi:hypothetical protein
VQLSNESLFGGLMIVTENKTFTSPDAENVPLYVRGLECRAREHRFGGVVVQPVVAWKAGE